MPIHDSSLQLQEQGVALMRDVFAKDSLTRLRAAAHRYFETIRKESPLPTDYQLGAHSVQLTTLLDFGCNSSEELVAPLATPGLDRLFSDAIACPWTCNLQQSWVRKKDAPLQAYNLQNWHQDGALGVTFPAAAGLVLPMTELLTCWIPFNPCGKDSPALEFVLGRQATLLHFTELEDRQLRCRFSPERFWAPVLEFGDGLVFLKDVLHRTYARPEMRYDRLSLEYRIFPQLMAEASRPGTACAGLARESCSAGHRA